MQGAGTDGADEDDGIGVPAHRRRRGKRKPLPESLPRVEVRHELPEEERCCPHDGRPLQVIGEVTSEQLDIVPATIQVLHHVRVQYACDCGQYIRTAPLPQTIAIGGSYTCSFSADVTGIGGDTETDTIVASGIDEGDDLVSAQGSATVNTLAASPRIRVRKTASPVIIAPGGEVQFSVLVSNLSTSQTVILESLDDDIYGDLDGQGNCEVPQTLGIGDSYGCSFSAPVNGASPSLHRNTVTGTAVLPTARSRSFIIGLISDSDSAFVLILALAGSTGIAIPALSPLWLIILALLLAGTAGWSMLRHR